MIGKKELGNKKKKTKRSVIIMKKSIILLVFYTTILSLLTVSLGLVTKHGEHKVVAQGQVERTTIINEKTVLKQYVPVALAMPKQTLTAGELLKKLEKKPVIQPVVKPIKPEVIQPDSLSYYKVNSEYLNVRSEPNAESKIIDTLVKGWVVEIDSIKENTWVPLKTGGFVYSKYVDFIDPTQVSKLLEEQKTKLKPDPTFSQPVVPATVQTNISTNGNEVQTSSALYSAADKDLLARLVRAEAGGEPYAGKVAVAQVVLNRIDSPKFPNTIRGVIYEPGQFSSVPSGAVNKPAPADCLQAVEEAINTHASSSNTALYFYDPVHTKTTWFNTLQTVARIGGHVFKK
jgi:hypothetical protein